MFIILNSLCIIWAMDGWLFLSTRTMPVENDFPGGKYLWNRFSRVIFILFFFAKFTSLKIEGVVVRLSFAVNIARFNNFVIIFIKLNLSLFSFMSRMRCYELDILLYSTLGTLFLCLTRQHYRKTVPSAEDNNGGIDSTYKPQYMLPNIYFCNFIHSSNLMLSS